MNYIPEKTFLGRNSNGTTFRVNQWSFQDLATLEIFQFLFWFVGGFLVAPFISPVLLLMAMLLYRHEWWTHLIFIFPMAMSGYFLLDSYNGWFMVEVASWFFNEKWVGYLVDVNIGVLVLSIAQLFCGWIGVNYALWPLNGITEEYFDLLNEDEKDELIEATQKRTKIVLAVGVFVFCCGVMGGTVINKQNNGWVKKNVDHHNALKEKAQKDEIMEAERETAKRFKKPVENNW